MVSGAPVTFPTCTATVICGSSWVNENLGFTSSPFSLTDDAIVAARIGLFRSAGGCAVFAFEDACFALVIEAVFVSLDFEQATTKKSSVRHNAESVRRPICILRTSGAANERSSYYRCNWRGESDSRSALSDS